MISPEEIRNDFPILTHNTDLTYLDSAATSLKPRRVIAKLTEYYEHYGANVHRGLYKLSERATQEYELSRSAVAGFIHAAPEEIIFTRNTTESINLVAYAMGRNMFADGGEIVTTVMEHHSNFVPWQQLAFENGVDFKVVDVTDDGLLATMGDGVITKRTKLLAITYVSNALGTVNPVKEIIAAARKASPGIIVIVDAAQAVQKLPIDVRDLDCDFLAFSSHKMLGPTGVGVLWGKSELMAEMSPFLYGGEMIDEVRIEGTTFKQPPHRYEAGTPDIGGVIALREAISYIRQFSWDDIRTHDRALVTYCIGKLDEAFRKNVRIIGPRDPVHRSGSVAFVMDGMHPHDIAQILDESDVAVRAGTHCAMPAHERFGVPATVRASFYLYNTKNDIDRLIEGLRRAQTILLR